jgi:outer membrane lipoprotein-sorting protein
MKRSPGEANNRPPARGARLRLACTCLLLITWAGCEKKPQEDSANTKNSNGAPSSLMSAAQIIERYRSLDNSHDSTIKMRALINSQEDQAGLNTPKQIQLTMYRKREPDGRLLILAEFTSPPEERDRDGLITVFPDGRIEAVRYVQSTDSFLVATDATSEDALFGLTPQELADGQPEKYDFTLVGEETYEGKPVYRLEGKLKQGAESKFPRLLLLISRQDFAPLEAEFYDNHSELARRLVVSKAEQISGHWTRLRWTIDNLARRKKIDFEAVEVKYDQNLSDSIFTREHLKKIASR